MKSISHDSILLAPSLLAGKHDAFNESLKIAESANVQWVHLDIMDGHFVPNISFGASTVQSLRKHSDLFFDVHLMLSNPNQHIDSFIDSGADLITIHVEPEYPITETIKSITHGYGSMDYEMSGYQQAKLCRLDIRVNSEPVDAFSSIVHIDKAEGRGRALCKRLKEILPRQLFKIAIQASVGSNIVSRETISAFRKDVTAKCYGGDISRKRKLLEKQKEGKKRMKNIGSVSIPQDAFIKILKTSESA